MKTGIFVSPRYFGNASSAVQFFCSQHYIVSSFALRRMLVQLAFHSDFLKPPLKI